jgi:hypothetical protein
MEDGESTPMTPESLRTVDLEDTKSEQERDLDSSDSDVSGMYNSNNLAGILEDNESQSSASSTPPKTVVNEKRLSANIGTLTRSPSVSPTTGTASWVQRNLFSKL